MSKTYKNRWKIIKSLDEGGQAHIFIVEDINTPGINYALKRLKNIDRIDRFELEIIAIQKLNHKNIIKLIDFDLTDKEPFFVTDFYILGSLAKYNLNEFDLSKKINIFLEICEGISYAHKNNIIHRDLKPSNIFIKEIDFYPIIGDFGICHLTGNGERLTLSLEAIGSKDYIAPELEDGRIDLNKLQSDIYSLGKIFYWIIAGKIFSREKHRELDFDLTKTINDPKIFIIYELLDEMINIEPNKRFNSVDEIIDEIKNRLILDGRPISDIADKKCIYCKSGIYKRINSNPKEYLINPSMNWTNIDIRYWRLLKCDKCGNIQMFHLDDEKIEKKWITKQ